VSAFPKTRAAAGYAAAHGRGDPAGHRATVLLRRLRACGAALAGADGRMAAVVHGLLRGLVQAARDLAGPAWLAAHSDDPGIAAFTALEATLGLPAPAELDEIIAGALWARFAPHAAAREDGVRADGERGSSCPWPGQFGRRVAGRPDPRGPGTPQWAARGGSRDVAG
jgi:hypothetical protein